jgi:hypothetical protein
VLGLEMEDIDSEPYIVEEGVIFDHFGKGTVVVEEDVIRPDVITKMMLYHFLLGVSVYNDGLELARYTCYN